jgi:C4-dicarboxylate-specific signal transduction histidine kinase
MSTSPVVYLLVVMLGLLMSVIISVYSESERLENEKKIRKTERDLAATKKMASLGIFSGGVAHEVNNPMSVILGSVHILKNLAKKEEIENPVVHKCLQHIEDHVHRIRTVTHSLQQYAEGVDSANFGVHNLRKIVEAAFYMAQGNNNSVTFKNNLPEDEDISIYCHDKLLTQAFYNLLMNSLEAIAGREHQWISLECSSTKTCVTIKIQDSGDGITPEVIDKMFFPFYTSKEVGEGVGLGLTLAEGIIDQHDGKLSFNPAAEHTEFIVEIPITHQG